MKTINSDKHTINQIAEYIEGFATGPFGGQHTSNRATIYNALVCIDDPSDGIEAWAERKKEHQAQDLDLHEMQIVKISGEDAVKLAKANNLPYKHPIFTISIEENKIYLCYDAWLDYDIDGYTHEQEWLLWPNDKSISFTTPDIIKDFSELQTSISSLSKSNVMFVNEILMLKAQLVETKRILKDSSNANPNPTKS